MPDYSYIRNKYYPLLRAVEFKFYLHRRGMIQDTIVMPVIDSTYMNAIKMIEERKYKQALVLLDDQYPEDYNTAICLMSLGYDKRALDIMLKQADTSDRNYILAILYVRLKEEELAVKSYIKSCNCFPASFRLIFCKTKNSRSSGSDRYNGRIFFHLV